MFRRKATSTNSDEQMTILLRRGFCPVALLQPSADSSTTTTKNQTENVAGSSSKVKSNFHSSIPHNSVNCAATTIPATEKGKDREQTNEQIDNFNNLDSTAAKHYRIVYSKKSMRKNKRWESDGFLTISKNNSYGVMRDEDCKVINSGGFRFTEDMIGGYDIFQFGGKDVRIDGPLDEHDARRLFKNFSSPFKNDGCAVTALPATTQNQIENVVGNVTTVKSNFYSSIPHSSANCVTTTIPATEKGDDCEQASEQIDNFNNLEDLDSTAAKHYRIVYSKKSMRKNKRWESDGFLTISKNNSYGVMRDEDCKVINSGGFLFTEDVIDGYDVFQFGGKDVRIDGTLDEHEAQRLFNK